MKHINEEDDYSKYYLKKIFTKRMGTLIFFPNDSNYERAQVSIMTNTSM